MSFLGLTTERDARKRVCDASLDNYREGYLEGKREVLEPSAPPVSYSALAALMLVVAICALLLLL